MTAAVGSRENPVPRRGSRVLVVDADGRVLLLRGSDPGRPGSRYWYTVGGGVAPGESDVEGAVRELYEETGLRASPAELDPIFEDVTDFPYDGVWYRQRQTYFLLRVDRYDVPADWLATQGEAGLDGRGESTPPGPPADEHSIDEYRWWSVDDLATTDEKVYPNDLAETLGRILGSA